MIIKFSGIHKSLRSFTSDELPKLTIITGKNGSGKSQLIELIQLRYVPANTNIDLTLVPEPKLIQVEGISVPQTTQVGNNNYRDMVTQFYNTYSQQNQEQKKLVAYILSEKLHFQEVVFNKDLIIKNEEFSTLLNGAYKNAYYIDPRSSNIQKQNIILGHSQRCNPF